MKSVSEKSSRPPFLVRFLLHFLIIPLVASAAVIVGCHAVPPPVDLPPAGEPQARVIQQEQHPPAASLPQVALQKMQIIQMPFMENKGQADVRVAFLANTFHGTVVVTRDAGIYYSLLQYDRKGQGPENVFGPPTNHSGQGRGSPVGRVVLEERLLGAATSRPNGSGQLPTRISRFRGADPDGWLTDIPAYGLVDFGEVYPGIDLRLRAHGNNVEKLFLVHPGAVPDPIRLQLRGATRLVVNASGELEAETRLGTARFTRPVAYQEIDGRRVEVAAEYVLHSPELGEPALPNEVPSGAFAYGFRVGAYDRNRELVIDPLLASTFLGGSGSDSGSVDFIDAGGNLYVTASTLSADFPVMPGAYDTTFNVSDVVISKLDGSLTTLLASTFLGGSQAEGGGSFATLAPNGSLYVVGQTSSPDFPTTAGAYDRTYNGGGDIFVARFDPSLTTLQASTFLGGADNDDGSLSIGPTGNLYISGATSSADFPTTAGAYDRTYHGGVDMFVALLDPSLSTLLASTFLGGSEDDFGGFSWGGNFIAEPIYVYVSALSTSADLPTTPNAYDRTYNGGTDNYIARFDEGLTTLIAATYLGGSDEDFGYALFTAGAAFVAGSTWSPDFPTTSGAYDPSYNGGAFGGDLFVAKLDESLTTLLGATYLGGSGDENGASLMVDAAGTVYTWGSTTSSDAPTTPGAYDRTYNGGGIAGGDIYLARLDGSLATLLAATYLGGGDSDFGDIRHIGADGSVLVAGNTRSLDYPTTPGAADDSYNGGFDLVVSRLDGALTTLQASTYLGGSSDENLFNVLVGAAGDIYLSGITSSTDFPTTPGAFDRSYNGTGTLGLFGGDLFIARLDLGTGTGGPGGVTATVDLASGLVHLPMVLVGGSAFDVTLVLQSGRLIVQSAAVATTTAADPAVFFPATGIVEIPYIEVVNAPVAFTASLLLSDPAQLAFIITSVQETTLRP